MRSPYRAAIESAATTHGLDADLVEALVWQESSGRADAFRYEPAFWRRYLATNPVYANEEPRRVASSYGLMQVMFTTALAQGFNGEPELLFDIRINLDIGCRVLGRLLARTDGDEAEALAAYNGGWGNRTGELPKLYAQRVLHRRRIIGEARR